MIEDIERVLLSEEQIHEIVSRLGRQISEDYKDKKLLMVSVLKGSVVFMRSEEHTSELQSQR